MSRSRSCSVAGSRAPTAGGSPPPPPRGCVRSLPAPASASSIRRRSSARPSSPSTGSVPTMKRRPGCEATSPLGSGRSRRAPMAEIRFDHASLVYPGAEEAAVHDLDLAVASGELMVLVGPSGSGKTTALRMLAGLEEVTAGAILVDGEDVPDLPPKDRDVAMVFQNYALYPYLDVAANIAFPLKMARVPKAERERRVREAAEVLELSEFLGRKPGQLSGGQRQRVAMGRAIVREPKAFLMDEPLSNLDAKLRVQMRAEIARIQRAVKLLGRFDRHLLLTPDEAVEVALDPRLLHFFDLETGLAVPTAEVPVAAGVGH